MLKFTFRANEHIIMMFNSSYSSYLYNILNGIPFALICLQCEGIYSSSMGISKFQTLLKIYNIKSLETDLYFLYFRP